MRVRPAIALGVARRPRTTSVADPATFSTDMTGFARRAEARSRYDRTLACLYYAPFHVGVCCWRVAVAVVYHLLRVTVNYTHRSQMPGDEDTEYQLDYVAAYARRVRWWCALVVGIVVTFATCYLVADAFYLHQHGLRIDVRPPVMSAATLAARESLHATELLTLYANGNESEQSLPAAARFRTQTRIEAQQGCDWRTMVARARAYLEANRGVEHCACAPMFGIDFNHLAFEMLEEGANQTRLVAVNFFNVDDLHYEVYDRLAPAVIERAALDKLVVVQQSQAHLFAWPPADAVSVAVLRQYTLALRAMHWNGASLALNVSAEQAYCAAECIDLFNGVSVYERARRQAAAGIKL